MTKTYRDIDAPLPPQLYPLLDAWLHSHRGRVSSAPSRYLFPNPSGELRSQGSLSAKLPRFVKRETGLTINLHLFRHLAAKVYLEDDPNGIEVVRQLLGHSTIKTTERVYAELRTDPAYRNFDKALQRLTSGRTPPPPRKGKGRR